MSPKFKWGRKGSCINKIPLTIAEVKPLDLLVGKQISYSFSPEPSHGLGGDYGFIFFFIPKSDP